LYNGYTRGKIEGIEKQKTPKRSGVRMGIMNEYTIQLFEDHEVLFDDNDEPWMSQAEIASLLGIRVPSVNGLIKRAERENLFSKSSIRQILIVAPDGKRRNVNYYNIDVILLTGYRTNETTPKVARFRKWVSDMVLGNIRDYKRNIENLTDAQQQERRLRIEAERKLNDAETKRRWSGLAYMQHWNDD